MKKMIVNCATCDMRKVSEETLQNYEKVMVNCATVLVTPRTKELLNRYDVSLNAGDVLEVPDGEDVSINSYNGTYELTGDKAPQPGEKALLMVNGSLTVGPDALEAAKAYQKIKVSGTVLLPKSMAGILNNLQVNGSVNAYPDGAILLTAEGQSYKCPAPKGKLINSVGAGDSMVAGFITGYMESNGDFEKAFHMGVATGSASAFSENLATRPEVEALLATIA